MVCKVLTSVRSHVSILESILSLYANNTKFVEEKALLKQATLCMYYALTVSWCVEDDWKFKVKILSDIENVYLFVQYIFETVISTVTRCVMHYYVYVLNRKKTWIENRFLMVTEDFQFFSLNLYCSLMIFSIWFDYLFDLYQQIWSKHLTKFLIFRKKIL